MDHRTITEPGSRRVTIRRRTLVVRAALILGVGACLSVLLAACGNGSSTTPTSASAGSQATSTMAGESMSSSPMSGPPIGMGTGASQVSQTQTVGNYKLTLMVGPQEQMYTQAQVGQQHPTSGEVMVSGSMSMPESSPMTGMATPLASTASGMAMGTNVEHLELHVYDNSSGKTVTDANVTIEVIDNTAQNMSTNVPIATMYGVQAGMDDFHYGNNVVMPPNRDYTVNVAINDQKATFTFHLGG